MHQTKWALNCSKTLPSCLLVVPCCCKEWLFLSVCDVICLVVCLSVAGPPTWKHDFWAAQAILSNLHKQNFSFFHFFFHPKFHLQKYFFTFTHLCISRYFMPSWVLKKFRPTPNFFSPKIFLQRAVGETRPNTMLPSILVFIVLQISLFVKFLLHLCIYKALQSSFLMPWWSSNNIPWKPMNTVFTLGDQFPWEITVWWLESEDRIAWEIKKIHGRSRDSTPQTVNQNLPFLHSAVGAMILSNFPEWPRPWGRASNSSTGFDLWQESQTLWWTSFWVGTLSEKWFFSRKDFQTLKQEVQTSPGAIQSPVFFPSLFCGWFHCNFL